MQPSAVLDFVRNRLTGVSIVISLSACLTHGATLLVYNPNDTGAGSLRQAVSDNNALGGGNTIVFSNTVTGTIALLSGELLATRDVNIVGPGESVLTVSGSDLSRVFHLTNALVNISGLTVANGNGSRGGGFLQDSGTLNLTRCVLSNNYSSSWGAGITASGTVALAECLVVQNRGFSIDGVGISQTSGSLLLTNCTFLQNTNTSGRGGALEVYLATAKIINCSFVSNNANFGGAIINYGTVAITNCTFTGNSAAFGGAINNFGTATVRNTLIAGNTASGSGWDCSGTFGSAGFNLIGAGNDSSGWTGLADQVGATNAPINALLGPLQNNGGSTPMLAPLPGSPAIDHGNSSGIPTDQRGRSRFNDNPAIINAVGGDGSDIGAVEVNPVTVYVSNTNNAGAGSLRQTIADAAAGDTVNFATNVTGAITFSNSAVTIAQDLTIRGPGARVLAVNGSASNHIFTVTAGAVVIAAVTLSNGQSVSGGGVQLFGGALTLSNCVVSGNNAGTNSGNGGGINASGGSLVVLNSTFSGNVARFGGGLWTSSGLVAISNTTFTANQAIGGQGSDGGAIHNQGMLTVQSCTIVSNSAGGAIAGAGGGGIRNLNVAHLGNSIIARNSAGGGELDAGGVFISDGYNFIGARTGNNGGGLTNGVSQDQVGTTNSPIDPLLSPLQDNGGPTPTMVLLANSPAIDKGFNNGLTTDQRGAPRPFDFAATANASGGDGSDIGAFELGRPTLNLQKSTTNAVVSWQSYYGDFTLQSVTNVILSNAWTTVAGTPVVSGNQYVLTNSPITGNKFYRLKGN